MHILCVFVFPSFLEIPPPSIPPVPSIQFFDFGPFHLNYVFELNIMRLTLLKTTFISKIDFKYFCFFLVCLFVPVEIFVEPFLL